MRLILLPAAVLVASSAWAQSDSYLASTAFKECVESRAAEYAQLEDPIAVLADAAVAACGEERNAMQDAFSKHYESIGGEAGTVATTSRSLVDELVSEATSKARSVIADSRVTAQTE